MLKKKDEKNILVINYKSIWEVGAHFTATGHTAPSKGGSSTGKHLESKNCCKSRSPTMVMIYNVAREHNPERAILGQSSCGKKYTYWKIKSVAK